MFGILFCVNHYMNLPSGTIFYTFSTQNWSPILQKGVLGTIRGHLQLQAPKNHKTITPGGPQNDTKSQQKVIKKHIKNNECFLRVPEHDILYFLMIFGHVWDLMFAIVFVNL